jgi:hypothetical protein
MTSYQDYKFVYENKTATFSLESTKIIFYIGERIDAENFWEIIDPFAMEIYIGSEMVYTRSSIGNDIFYQNDELFNYLSWQIFEKMRYLAAYFLKGYGLESKGDRFIHLDGPNKRLKELGYHIHLHKNTRDWVKLRLSTKYKEVFNEECSDHEEQPFPPDLITDQIWERKLPEDICLNTDDKELLVELQYIADRVFTCFKPKVSEKEESHYNTPKETELHGEIIEEHTDTEN